MSEEIHDALDVGIFVHQEVPDFMVSNNKPKSKPVVEVEEPAAFTLFDQDLADKITEEGQSILANMVSEVVQRSHNTITANPEAGRTWEVIF